MMSSNSCQLLSLEAVKEDFDKWRRNRKKLEKTPDYLWEKVQQLTKTYKYQHIARELNLCKADMMSALTKRFAPETISFVEVLPEPIPPMVEDALAIKSSSLEVKRPDGTILVFNHLQADQLTRVLERLLAR